jgi:CxxC-x17-CxxC domain-containing protein
MAISGWDCPPIQAALPQKRFKKPQLIPVPTGPEPFTTLDAVGQGRVMDFVDRTLKCVDCGSDFVFTAGEQLFFHDKQFKNDPKRCKNCKAKRASGAGGVRSETRTVCSECAAETTVPFKPTQGRPVLCRQCFQQRRTPQAS